jgi:hypothetical protein
MSGLLVSSPLLLVLTLVLIGHISSRWDVTAQPLPVCGTADMQDQVRAAMFVGLDEAFRARIGALYNNWLNDRGHPQRAKSGIEIAIAGYLHGYKVVEEWKLPPCR